MRGAQAILTKLSQMSMAATVTDWIQAFSAVAIVVLTYFLVRSTRQYAAANERMVQSIERDFAQRYRAIAELEAPVTKRDESLYSVDSVVTNKGLAPLRIDRVSVRIGTRELATQTSLSLAVGERRPIPSVRFSLKDLGLQHLKEGDCVDVVVKVEFRDFDGTPRALEVRPWTEYRNQASLTNPP